MNKLSLRITWRNERYICDKCKCEAGTNCNCDNCNIVNLWNAVEILQSQNNELESRICTLEGNPK